MNSTETFSNAAKSYVDTVTGLAGKTLQGVEQLSTLNLQLTKTLLAEAASGAQVVLAAKTPEEFVKLQTATLQAAPQKAAGYVRQVQDIVTGVADAYRAVAEAQAAEAQSRFFAAIDGALKDVSGNEQAVALAKSAIAAAKNAVEGVNKASKQVADALTENVAKLADPV